MSNNYKPSSVAMALVKWNACISVIILRTFQTLSHMTLQPILKGKSRISILSQLSEININHIITKGEKGEQNKKRKKSLQILNSPNQLSSTKSWAS